jgi:hypothetical protein
MEAEAKQRGLEADRMTLDEDGRHVFENDTAGVRWGLDDELPDNPPLAPWPGGIPQ